MRCPYTKSEDNDDEEDHKKRSKDGNKKRFHKKSLYFKEDSDDDDEGDYDESEVLFMGLEIYNENNINFENQEKLETYNEIDFEKEFYYALDEIKRPAKKKPYLKEKLL